MNEIIVRDDAFDRELGRLTECLEATEPDSKEYTLILKSIKSLEGLRVEEARIRMEEAKATIENLKLEFEQQYRELEADMREKHHEEDLKARMEEAILRKRMDTIRLCIEILGLILPLIFCWTWMSRGLAFEETHVFTSTTFRGLMNKFTGLFI